MTTKAQLEQRLAQIMALYTEARDALCAISLANAKLYGVDLSLANRMDATGMTQWRPDNQEIDDAQRYQWLINNSTFSIYTLSRSINLNVSFNQMSPDNIAELDDAIDVAIMNS